MHILPQAVLTSANDGVVEVVAGRFAVHHKGSEVAVDAVLGCNGGRPRSHESLLDRILDVRHLELFLSYRSPKGNGRLSTRSKWPGRVLHPSVAVAGTVSPVGILKDSKPEAALLVGNNGEVCGPGLVAKQMICRPHVSFCGLRRGPRKLVNRIEDVVGGDLCEAHHGSSDCPVAPFLLPVQQLLPRLVQEQFRPYSGGVRGVVAFHTVPLHYVLR